MSGPRFTRVLKVHGFTRWIWALASLERQIFLLVKKNITLLTCCINNYSLIFLIAQVLCLLYIYYQLPPPTLTVNNNMINIIINL
ncbi:unnamed protein product [Tenebrio molitor]|nr:unnamed protein product [Tenebrio molitor]